MGDFGVLIVVGIVIFAAVYWGVPLLRGKKDD